jgi:hypothetical protein
MAHPMILERVKFFIEEFPLSSLKSCNGQSQSFSVCHDCFARVGAASGCRKRPKRHRGGLVKTAGAAVGAREFMGKQDRREWGERKRNSMSKNLSGV